MNFSEESAWIEDGEEEGGQTALPGKILGCAGYPVILQKCFCKEMFRILFFRK